MKSCVQIFDVQDAHFYDIEAIMLDYVSATYDQDRTNHIRPHMPRRRIAAESNHAVLSCDGISLKRIRSQVSIVVHL